MHHLYDIACDGDPRAGTSCCLCTDCIEDFVTVWREMHAEGLVEAVGTEQYRRHFAKWVEMGPTGIPVRDHIERMTMLRAA